MVAKTKARGNALEREIVKDFTKFNAIRAWGSDGRALGFTADIDVYVKDLDLKIQAKRRKKLANYLGFTSNVDAVIIREDRGERYILMKVSRFLEEIEK